EGMWGSADPFRACQRAHHRLNLPRREAQRLTGAARSALARQLGSMGVVMVNEQRHEAIVAAQVEIVIDGGKRHGGKEDQALPSALAGDQRLATLPVDVMPAQAGDLG